MINLHESMVPGRDRTRDPWNCSQTRICSQTRYRLRYAARCNLEYDIACIYPRPYMTGLVTGGNTKLCCRGFVLLLFQSNTVYKIDSDIPETIQSYSRNEKVEIL